MRGVYASEERESRFEGFSFETKVTSIRTEKLKIDTKILFSKIIISKRFVVVKSTSIDLSNELISIDRW